MTTSTEHWFVLRRQPVKEQDWLLDLFSKQAGLVQVRVSPPTEIPDLLSCYSGGWQANKDWPKLKGVQRVSEHSLNQESLVCALYLTELLIQLLGYHDPQPEIFELYQKTLSALASSPAPEPWLRLFEYQLLQHLGYGFEWHLAGGQAVFPDQRYQFQAGEGLVLSAQGWLGEPLLAIAKGEWSQPGCLQVAKQVLREALALLLPRPLISRDLL